MPKGGDPYHPMGIVSVYVPCSQRTSYIRQGSGIVGEIWPNDPGPTDELRVHIYYEGNIHGSSNIQTWADRVMHAAGRMWASYPTIAQAVVPRGELYYVGDFDWETNQVRLFEDWPVRSALSRWLSLDSDSLLDLHCYPGYPAPHAVAERRIKLGMPYPLGIKVDPQGRPIAEPDQERRRR